MLYVDCAVVCFMYALVHSCSMHVCKYIKIRCNSLAILLSDVIMHSQGLLFSIHVLLVFLCFQELLISTTKFLVKNYQCTCISYFNVRMYQLSHQSTC